VSKPTDKRQAVLDAALALFAERGFHGTAVPLIAERAKVGAGTIYRYFQSKEELVNELYFEWKTQIGSALTAHFPLGAPIRDQVVELIRRLAAFAEAHPTAIAFLELHHHGPYLDARNQALVERFNLPMLAMIERAQAQQLIKPIPAQALQALVQHALFGVWKEARTGRIRYSAELVEQVAECLWEAIRR
jgi:AcrR family transcriptional regulator